MNGMRTAAVNLYVSAAKSEKHHMTACLHLDDWGCAIFRGGLLIPWVSSSKGNTPFCMKMYRHPVDLAATACGHHNALWLTTNGRTRHFTDVFIQWCRVLPFVVGHRAL